MYKSILIPVDLGNVAKVDSLVEQATIYNGSDAKITLLNVVEDIPRWAAVELPRGILDKSIQSSTEKLQALAGSLDIAVDVEVRVGHPYQSILEVAKEKNSELIIVASHPYSDSIFVSELTDSRTFCIFTCLFTSD